MQVRVLSIAVDAVPFFPCSYFSESKCLTMQVMFLFFFLQKNIFISVLTLSIKDAFTYRKYCGGKEVIKKRKTKKAEVGVIITKANFQSKCF